MSVVCVCCVCLLCVSVVCLLCVCCVCVVCVGGLYEATQADQGRDGSATDVMCPAKLKINGQGKCTTNMCAHMFTIVSLSTGHPYIWDIVH